MKPTKSSNNKITNCTPTSSECIIWEGPDLDCIEPCFGDTIGDVIKKITEELCALRTENDLLLTLTQLGCLPIVYNTVDGQQVADLTLKTTVLTLIEEHCDLVERVDFLSTPAGSDAVPPTLSGVNLTCLTAIDTLGSGLPGSATDVQIVQHIVNGLCATWADLQTNLETIYSRLDTLGTGTGTGTVSLPTLTSGCLWSGSKTISVAWGLFDTDYCAYKAKLGSIAEIDAIITAENSCLTALNDPTTGLFIPQSLSPIVASTTEAHAVENLWKTICALNAKVATMQEVLNFCCGFSCKKFEVGVTAINFDADAKEIDLRFSFDGSTTLPTGTYDFVDKGSTVIFTDSTGYSLASQAINITVPSSYVGLDITGLDLSGEIQVDVDLEYEVTDPITGNVFTCTKCLHTFFKTGVACAFCVLQITISGDDPEIRINYTVGTSVSTLVLTTEGSGMEYVLPAGATITSIINVNNSLFTIGSTTCPNLVIPEVETLACYAVIISNDFFGPNPYNAGGPYYNIVGWMMDGIEYTYTTPTRADLTNARDVNQTAGTYFNNSYTTGTAESTTNCTYPTADPSINPALYVSLSQLQNLPVNTIITSVEKLCTLVSEVTAPGEYQMVNNYIIIKAIANKNIFLRLTPTDINITNGIEEKPSSYLKAIEIAAGEDCDCCAVYNGE